MQFYDAIVLGIGGVGSAALDQLAQRGLRVVGIDRFHPPHNRGSTHGHTRVIRQAYYEHPNYVPLLKESYRLWRALEVRCEETLYHEVGLIEIGPANGILIPGVLNAAGEHGLNVQTLAVADIQECWRGIRPRGDVTGVFEREAGYLLVENCVDAQLRMARNLGARLMFDTLVHGWTAREGDVRVQTDQGEIAAERLVITAGPWAYQMLAGLNIPLTIRRKSLFWFATKTEDYNVSGGFPVFLFEIPEGSPAFNLKSQTHGSFYGFPKIDERGIKVGEHSGGRKIDDPLEVDSEIDLGEQQRIADVLSGWLPFVSDRVTDHTVCLYTMSPDGHFIVDRHPAYPNVVFAAGLSGHGFKFAPVLGLALTQLVVDGATQLPIDFLSLNRLRAV